VGDARSQNPAIQAQGLTKYYGDILAVDSLDLHVDSGTIYALLGPNGAGKTTTLSMLTTLITPNAGTAQIAGADITRQPGKVRKRIGVTFQEIVLDSDLTGREVLDYHGRLYGMATQARIQQIVAMLKLVELEEAADRLVKHYSGGMKRRLELARGLMTQPEVLFLDEPTQGLDPQNRGKVWDYLRMLRVQQGLTILLTTHYMEEAEALADRVGILDAGKLIVEGTPAELTAEIGGDRIRISGRGSIDKLIEQLRKLAFVREAYGEAGRIEVGVDAGNKRLAEIVQASGKSGFEIEEISIATPSLGDVFLKYTGRALRDK
jgi:ABC-2 type transport system ATP-binding protein